MIFSTSKQWNILFIIIFIKIIWYRNHKWYLW